MFLGAPHVSHGREVAAGTAWEQQAGAGPGHGRPVLDGASKDRELPKPPANYLTNTDKTLPSSDLLH